MSTKPRVSQLANQQVDVLWWKGDYFMLLCGFCSEEGSLQDFELDSKNGLGFWCPSCDGFTYFIEGSCKHRFTLILEDKTKSTVSIPKPSKKLRKQLSPLRYPGGKSKLSDYLYQHLQQTKTKHLVSPFTGGGSFELAVLDAGVVERLYLNDLDYGIYSLWWTILNSPTALVDKLLSITPTHQHYFEAQALIKSGFSGAHPIEAAWATLLVNRLAYSGIFKANPLGGKEGTVEALLSRWNTKALIKRIEYIHSFAGQIEVSQNKAIEIIEESYWKNDCTIFIDPPYVEKGKDLYNCFYTTEDHLELSFLLDSLHQGMPGADIVLTYDHSEWLEQIYEYPTVKTIGRSYSI